MLVDFEITCLISNWIALHLVQLPLLYIEFTLLFAYLMIEMASAILFLSPN